MKIIVAHAEVDGICRDADLANELERRARADGHDVAQLVMPDSLNASPQQRALPWQLLPIAAYADELWSINFPACAARHARRRIWITRISPFDSACAPVSSLGRLIASEEGETQLAVSDARLAAALGIAYASQPLAAEVAPLLVATAGET